MKKNFLMVASLLIAAMLLVVSCSQEVKAPENELVETTIGLAYGKDVTVGYGDSANITYKYTLSPLWDNLNNGAPIYGATEGEVKAYSETKKIGATLESFKSNYVTPGYWNITVNGYVNGVAVLTGTTKAYFNKANSSATVYVSPVKTASNGKLTVNLVMEDLDADDAGSGTSKIYFTLDDSTTKNYVTKGNAVTGSLTAAHNYAVELETVTSGYHTITIKVEGYEDNGGVTKSFLMIPGNDVTISGSIYPSKFIDSESTIKVVSLGKKTLTAAGKAFTATNNSPVVVTDASVSVSIAEFDAPITTEDAEKFGYTLPVENKVTYTWYLDGVKNGENTNSNSATITLPTTTNGSENVLVPGDYTITCVASYTYTDANGGPSITVYGGDEYAGKVRVEANNKKYQAPASNE